jgi:LacI family repressor for deo operon, udp, cdd, tsx, nupC, and nupG
MISTSGGPTDDRRPARMKDVAAATGVSFKTVSNVVHGKPNVGEQTRARVWAAIAELGYRPDLAGRQLRQGRTTMLTLVVPEIVSPYFAALAHATIEAAREHGYAVFIEETGGSRETEQELLGSLSTRVFDGMIFSPISASVDALLALGKIVPTVFLGEHIEGGGLDHLTYDNVASMQVATDHLIGRGRRQIVFLGIQQGHVNHTGQYRFNGYRAALDKAGISYKRKLAVAATEYSREEGALRMTEFLRQKIPFDGLVCANDLLAMGALFALRQHGLRVPEDVSVIGWDDNPEGRFSQPTLSTIAPDVAELARTAVRVLIRRIERPGSSPERHTIGHRLLVRESTAGSHQA